MQFLRCIYAEWLLVRPRLARTRAGLFLLILGLTLVWVHAGGADPLSVALHAGSLGAILSATSAAGAGTDRAALALALTHPTTPLAIATGRFLAAVGPAAALIVISVAVTGGRASAAGAGLLAAAAVGGCALALVLAFGKGAGAGFFLLMAVAGAIPPERLVAVAHPGVARLAAASVLELGPALWHYRDVASGDLRAAIHAAAWAGLGVIVAGWLIARKVRP